MYTESSQALSSEIRHGTVGEVAEVGCGGDAKVAVQASGWLHKENASSAGAAGGTGSLLYCCWAQVGDQLYENIFMRWKLAIVCYFIIYI